MFSDHYTFYIAMFFLKFTVCLNEWGLLNTFNLICHFVFALRAIINQRVMFTVIGFNVTENRKTDFIHVDDQEPSAMNMWIKWEILFHSAHIAATLLPSAGHMCVSSWELHQTPLPVLSLIHPLKKIRTALFLFLIIDIILHSIAKNQFIYHNENESGSLHFQLNWKQEKELTY